MNFASILLAAAVTAGGDGQLAQADLAKFPPEHQKYIYHITSEPLDSEEAR